jgi:hypothetical protein
MVFLSRPVFKSDIGILRNFRRHMCATTLMYAYEASSLGIPLDAKIDRFTKE